jgi:hypothetical protein
MKPKFVTLIVLTVFTVVLLAPFALSPLYLASLRESDFELYQVLTHNEIYKQITGYIALLLVLLEMALTARKRGRAWALKVVLPGSVLLWRSVHIFLGVGLLAVVLIHTAGSNGLNFNGIFLWVFFGVTLSALVGVLTETGLVESPRRVFGWVKPQTTPEGVTTSTGLTIAKGPLIRNLRTLWLNTHIILVSMFGVLLIFHMFLAYYFQ